MGRYRDIVIIFQTVLEHLQSTCESFQEKLKLSCTGYLTLDRLFNVADYYYFFLKV